MKTRDQELHRYAHQQWTLNGPAEWQLGGLLHKGSISVTSDHSHQLPTRSNSCYDQNIQHPAITSQTDKHQNVKCKNSNLNLYTARQISDYWLTQRRMLSKSVKYLYSAMKSEDAQALKN